MSVCKDCGGIGGHKTWCAGPPVQSRRELTDAFIANAHPDSIAGQLFPRRRPIRVFQCKDDCCFVKVPSERRWYVQMPFGKVSTDTFAWALQIAHQVARTTA